MTRSLLLLALVGPLFASEPREFFETRIRPVFVKNCYGCHTQSPMGGLQLDTREHVLKGGKTGPAIVPGDPDKSLLYQAVAHTHERLKMPPGGKLSDAELADIATWIRDGAVWGVDAPSRAPGYIVTSAQRAFWSFQPVRKPGLPPVKATRWAKTPIDRFILAKLEQNGLQPAPAADKRTLIRRATLDLTGLLPTPEDVNAFLSDNSPGAFAKVVDRLLASPQYGERWGRYWLDVARYSDDKLDSERDNPYPSSFRYRDWVIGALNRDMPYNQFVEAQIAGDLIDAKTLEPALGFYALSPEFQDDRVDATTRGFLGLTVACAQCHDHKFDPIPTKDYYALLGVFTSTELHEYPLAPADVVEKYKAAKKKADDQQAAIESFIKIQAQQLAEVLAAQTARYMLAGGGGSEPGLDAETLTRWRAYLKRDKEHPFLKNWDGSEAQALEFQKLVLAVAAEKKEIDEKNKITLGLNPKRSDLASAKLISLERDRYVLWNDLFGSKGVLYYDGKKIDRFLGETFREHLSAMRTELDALKKVIPPQYPFVQAIRDNEHPADERIQIRGSHDNLGDVAPRAFLTILSAAQPVPFRTGSGRRELADAIADPANPLTARVFVNRVWQHHFGQGLVRTPSNFGQLGDRPSHPELLDYLAAAFVENGWSVKKLHREIMLSGAYALSSAYDEHNFNVDPENRLLWRANRRRMDVESLRDSILFAAGDLDCAAGGPALKLADAKNRRRTVYGFVSRRKLDGTLALFDFPNPNNTSEQRMQTNVPLQRLFFLNSGFVQDEAAQLAARLKTLDSDPVRVERAYQLLFSRAPTPEEQRMGLEFLRANPWPRYAQVLLASNEFAFVD